MSSICHIHNYTEYNQQWNVFSALNPSKCTHTWSSGQPTLWRPGSRRGFGAWTIPARAEIQTHDLGLQVQRSIHWATTQTNSLTWDKRRRTGLDCCPVVQSPLFRWEQVLYFIWNQGPRVWRKGGEAHRPSCLKSSVKFPQSVMIWVQCHLLVLIHCVFWKPTSLHPFTKKF